MREAFRLSVKSGATESEHAAVASLFPPLITELESVSTGSSRAFELVGSAGSMGMLLSAAGHLGAAKAVSRACALARRLETAAISAKTRAPEMGWLVEPILKARAALVTVRGRAAFLNATAPLLIERAVANATGEMGGLVQALFAANPEALEAGLAGVSENSNFALGALAKRLESFFDNLQGRADNITSQIGATAGQGIGRVLEELRVMTYLENASSILESSLSDENYAIIDRYRRLGMMAASMIPSKPLRGGVMDAIELADSVIDMSKKIPTYVDYTKGMITQMEDSESVTRFINDTLVRPLMRYAQRESLRTLQVLSSK